MSRFFCPGCQTNVHDSKIAFVIRPPRHPAPWAPFEGELYPAPCKVCKGELVDTLARKQNQKGR